MRRIESFEDDRRGVVTYELPDGRWITLSAQAVRDYGIAEVLRMSGHASLVPTGRVVVMQDGLRVGTVPATFIQSRSELYDPSPGDFRREGDRWVASGGLGMGDLRSIPGFRPD
jgi:hypothetical protein